VERKERNAARREVEEMERKGGNVGTSVAK
jgi:hypothetical protein